MIKNIHLSALAFSIACLLTVSGCDKFGKKDDTTADTSGKTATSQKTAINADEVCADKNIPTNLEKSLKDKFVQESTQTSVTLDADKVTAESDKISFTITDVKAVDDAKVSESGLVNCQANVSLELPEDMVSRANAVYKANNQEDDVLDANRIKDEAFAFTVNTNVKEDNLQILGQSALLGVVSNTLANSVSKAQGGTSTTDNSTSSNTSSASSSSSQQAVNKTSSSEAKKQAQARAKKRAEAKARAKRQAEARAKKQAQAKAQQKKQPVAPAKTAEENAVIKAQRAKEGIKDTKEIKQKISAESIASEKKPVVKAQPKPTVVPVKKAPQAKPAPVQKAPQAKPAPTPQAKPAPVKKAPAQSKPLGVKNAENIEVVIVEEDGTY